jgi:hypothetical protein
VITHRLHAVIAGGLGMAPTPSGMIIDCQDLESGTAEAGIASEEPTHWLHKTYTRRNHPITPSSRQGQCTSSDTITPHARGCDRRAGWRAGDRRLRHRYAKTWSLLQRETSAWMYFVRHRCGTISPVTGSCYQTRIFIGT